MAQVLGVYFDLFEGIEAFENPMPLFDIEKFDRKHVRRLADDSTAEK